MSLSMDLPSRLCRSVFTVLMVWTWTGGATRAAERSAATPSVTAEITPEKFKEYATRVRSTMARLDQAVAKIDRTSFDPAAFAASLGKEPPAILDAVRARIGWVPYLGALRGPRGVLMDGAGNSLDRAWLMAEMLRSTGRTARLAHAELSAEQASSLIQRAEADAEAARKGLAGLVKGPVNPAVSDELRLRMERLSESLAKRVSEQSEQLLALLPKRAPVEIKPGEADEAALQAAKDHWWVQLEQDGNWVDLDPLAHDKEIGKTIAPAAETVDFNEQGMPSLAPERFHEVVVRVVIERTVGGQSEEAIALDHPLRVAETGGRRLTLRLTPQSWPDGQEGEIFGGSDRLAQLRKILLAQKQWCPVLIVAGANIIQKGFDAEGQLVDDPQPLPFREIGKTVAGGIGGFLKDFDAPPGDKKPVKGELTAVWLEMESRSPGTPSRTFRRVIYDRSGPAARSENRRIAAPASEDERFTRALALMGHSELLLCGGRISPDAAMQEALQQVIAQRTRVDRLLQAGIDDAEPQMMSEVARLDRFPAELFAVVVGRPAMSSVRKSQLFANRPAIFCEHARLQTGPADAPIKGSLTIDIVENELASRNRAGADPFRDRLVQGVIDTNLEALVLPGRRAGFNAADLYQEYVDQGQPWDLIQADTQLGGKRYGALSADIRARMKQDLKTGAWLVIPPTPKAGPIAWWRIDPKTGTTLGISSTGEGATMIEYAQLLFALVVGVVTMGGCGGFDRGVSRLKFGLCAVCAVIAATLALALAAEIAEVGIAGALKGGAAATAMGEAGVELVCNIIDWGLN